MFAGIIEAIAPIIESRPLNQAREIIIERPPHFEDLKIGDSIAVNGVCLTVEAFDLKTIKFTLGFETLKVLGEAFSHWLDRPVNMERSLAFGARMHGHFVTGHVEALAPVVKSEALGDNWLLTIQLTPDLRKYCWKKGSLAINGVSLTVNSIENDLVEVCLIPETQKRTNLAHYKVGENICFEPDSFAKAIVHALANGLVNTGGMGV